jgi:DNA-binding CsgD family transcriptional regulator
VRSQVKSVLRKLDVNSQLAAVAAFGSLREDPDLQFSWPDE